MLKRRFIWHNINKCGPSVKTTARQHKPHYCSAALMQHKWRSTHLLSSPDPRQDRYNMRQIRKFILIIFTLTKVSWSLGILEVIYRIKCVILAIPLYCCWRYTVYLCLLAPASRTRSHFETLWLGSKSILLFFSIWKAFVPFSIFSPCTMPFRPRALLSLNQFPLTHI